MENEQNDLHKMYQIPAIVIPTYRQVLACKYKIEKNIIITAWGGIGDQICAEPTLRYALKKFTDCDISLACYIPELFSHLKFKKVYNLNENQPIWEKYYPFQTIYSPEHILWSFISHGTTHCVDFPSISCFRSQLPVADKEINLPDCDKLIPEIEAIIEFPFDYVVVHPGKHWPTKTFPKDWWDAVLARIIDCRKVPVLVGKNVDENRATVDVETAGCLDLRNKTSIAELIHLLKNCRVLLTNDSAPLHMAAAGNAWIGFCSTAKHPDYITHWRNGQWGWQMKNFASSGFYDLHTICPNQPDIINMDKIEESVLRSWLPLPEDFAAWAVDKLKPTH